jgi:hypothetical protein
MKACVSPGAACEGSVEVLLCKWAPAAAGFRLSASLSDSSWSSSWAEAGQVVIRFFGAQIERVPVPSPARNFWVANFQQVPKSALAPLPQRPTYIFPPKLSVHFIPQRLASPHSLKAPLLHHRGIQPTEPSAIIPLSETRQNIHQSRIHHAAPAQEQARPRAACGSGRRCAQRPCRSGPRRAQPLQAGPGHRC